MSVRKRRIYFWLGFAITVTVLVTFNCGADKRKLVKNYKGNAQWHQEIADSLMYFCQIYGGRIQVKKTFTNHVAFHIEFPNSSEYKLIEYDTAFNRHDHDPEQTSDLHIPMSVIRNFSKGIYWALWADNQYVFFSYEWRVKPIPGTQGDRQIGIMIDKYPDYNEKGIKKLAPNAYIAESAVH